MLNVLNSNGLQLFYSSSSKHPQYFYTFMIYLPSRTAFEMLSKTLQHLLQNFSDERHTSSQGYSFSYRFIADPSWYPLYYHTVRGEAIKLHTHADLFQVGISYLRLGKRPRNINMTIPPLLFLPYEVCLFPSAHLYPEMFSIN